MSVPSRGASMKRASSVLRSSSAPDRMSAGVTKAAAPAAAARTTPVLAKNAANAERMKNSALHHRGGDDVADARGLTMVTCTDVDICVSPKKACPEPALLWRQARPRRERHDRERSAKKRRAAPCRIRSGADM